MECLCGKTMTCVMEDKEAKLRLWSCPPEGCGRAYLESIGREEIEGTWYTAEQNEVKKW